jgi:hypothetical protein
MVAWNKTVKMATSASLTTTASKMLTCIFHQVLKMQSSRHRWDRDLTESTFWLFNFPVRKKSGKTSGPFSEMAKSEKYRNLYLYLLCNQLLYPLLIDYWKSTEILMNTQCQHQNFSWSMLWKVTLKQQGHRNRGGGGDREWYAVLRFSPPPPSNMATWSFVPTYLFQAIL